MIAIITIGIDPTIELGPITLAWHGITIALGILIGALAAERWLRERDLPPEPMHTRSPRRWGAAWSESWL